MPSPSVLEAFFASAPPWAASSLPALAVAPVLTDEIAALLLDSLDVQQAQSRRLLRALHLSGLVIERNSEWELRPDVRDHLLSSLSADTAMRLHSVLLDRSRGDKEGAGIRIPSYLVNGVGEAYHATAIGGAEAVDVYSRASHSETSGREWMLGQLALEQQRRGVIPAHAIEPAFINGMLAYREGHYREAEGLLEPVARSDESRLEVAIAAHVVGKLFQRRRLFRDAEELLRRSLKLGEDIGNRHHQAQVLHSLGQLLWNKNRREGERLLRRSLKLEEDIGDQHGQAQVLHSLGQKLWNRDPEEAEEFLRRSLKLLEDIGDWHGQAQVGNTLGLLLRKSKRWRDAQDAYQSVVDLRADQLNTAIALEGLSHVSETGFHDLRAAVDFLNRAVTARRRSRDRRRLASMEARLRNLRRRLR